MVTASQAKARQSAKIREIADSLHAVGCKTLDERAKTLGLCRSTTWTLISGSHKGSGLSAHLINRMLALPTLSMPVRKKIIEYLEERLAGLHGHSWASCGRFGARLGNKLQPIVRNVLDETHYKNPQQSVR